MNWEVILWTCITDGIILCAIGIWYMVKSVDKSKRQASDEQTNNLEKGSKVMLANGIYGNVVAIEGDIVDVEIAPNVVVKVSQYGVNEIK